ncbi:MAG: MFS transporter [Candidatus Thermoplasmatota archaeon]|nr:MFS transporter [Candidatus Thermoplasmatota archaeon]MCL5889057.1 MFS transporter [Candidatus Thermoplasmatota archaeon]
MKGRNTRIYLFAKIKEYTVSSDDTVKSTANLSITDGLFWSIYSSLTVPFIIPLSIFLLGKNAPVGYITGFPVLVVPLSQFLSRHFSSRSKDLKKLTIYTTLLDRILWVPVVFLVFVHGYVLTYALLILLLSIRTFFASFSGTTWTLWVPGVIPAQNRSGYFAFRNFVMKIFSLVGYALALGIFLRIGNEEIAFILVFLLGALAFSSISLLVMSRIHSYSIPDSEKAINHNKLPYRFRNLVIYSIIWGIGYSMILPYFQLYLISSKYLGLSESFYTIIYITISISFIASQILWGKLAARFGNFSIVAINSAAIIISAVLIPSIRSSSLIFVPAVLYGVGQSGITLSLFNEMLSRSDSSRINSISVYNMAQSISMGIGPILANFLVEAFNVNIEFVFELSTAFMALSIVYFIVGDLIGGNNARANV